MKIFSDQQLLKPKMSLKAENALKRDSLAMDKHVSLELEQQEENEMLMNN